MGTETNTQSSNLPAPIPPDLIPTEQGSEIDPIRTETIFSRMPLHVLSKSGPRPEINIEKRSADGRLQERWEVSYNEKYGTARQLAYDVHTLVIERAIEEAFEEARRTGQPFPRIIPLSSLNEVANRLGPHAETRNTNRIKKALGQNAGILITAFKRYRGNDGVEYVIEGVFTPYGIFFFGQKLPDGRRADQVYINLNEPYFEAWSRGSTRPLDYNYKAQLPPIPRRFYELVSYQMYGAIKNSQPTARYRYSEFCKNAPQLRYDTFDQVKKQMYKIHKPHVDADYILKVKYEQTTDEQGRVDWWMIYIPGARAYAEFAAFAGKKLPGVIDAIRFPTTARKYTRRPRQKFLSLQPEVDSQLLAALTSRGVSATAARKVLADLPADFPVLDTLEWGEQQIQQQPRKFTNPPGFYISLLQARTTPPPTFESSAVRKSRQEAILREQQAREEATATEIEEERVRNLEIEAQIAQLQANDPDRYRALYDQAKLQLSAQFPKMAQVFGSRVDSPLGEGAIRARLRELLKAFPHQATNKTSSQSDLLEELQPVAAFTEILQTVLNTPQLVEPSEPQPAATQPEEDPQS